MRYPQISTPNIFVFFNLFFISSIFFGGNLTLHAQSGKYAAYFDEAYRLHPSVPEGLLEAIAYTNTRLNHLDGHASCQELPDYYGVMGLVQDGKGYFQNSLGIVSELSGYSNSEIKDDPRTNILAYAAAYAKLQENKRLMNDRVENHQSIIQELSEIPQDTARINAYARNQQFFGILSEIQNPHTKTGHRLDRRFDLKKVFGEENYRVLSSKRVSVSNQRITNEEGDQFRTGKTTCTRSKPRPDFKGAIWKAAHSSNYGSRAGEPVQYVTIHTIQGSYASAISWFRNKRARVSAHYVIRSSDGQITQMVCETDKAYHVRSANSNSIGIEHEGFVGDGSSWYSNEMYESSAELVRDLCKRHGIDPLKTFGGPATKGVRELSNTCYHIKGHQHFNGNDHVDPGEFWDWDRYYRLINGTPKPNSFTSKTGEILDSGKKRSNYGDQERITYLIQPRNAASITLNFVEFDLEGTTKEPFDYLDIYDGKDINGKYLGRFTGSRNPGKIVANSGSVFMEFRSDCRVNKKGFHIKYTSQGRNPDCPPPGELVAKDLFAMGGRLTWKGNRKADKFIVLVKRRNQETRWHTFQTLDEEITLTGLSTNGLYQWQVQSVCGTDSSALVGQSFLTPNIGRSDQPQVFTIRQNEGKFFDSGGLLGGYIDNENYVYRIIPPNGKKVILTFSEFDTEVNSDVLTIYDGTNINSDPRLGIYSGKNSPGQVVSSGNGLSLVFQSDKRIQAEGWVATWRTTESALPTPVDDDESVTPPVVNPPVVDNDADFKIGGFDPDPFVHRYAPETEVKLKKSYNDDFSVSFNDKDRSGKGLANRFYCLAYEGRNGFRANGNAGFLNEDFERGLSSEWENISGKWLVQDGYLVQTDDKNTNTNLSIPVKQGNDAVYIYHWQAKMMGNSDNLRHGMHFFVSEPEKSNRGNSYFIWVRDTDEGDFLEIYKSAFNQFDRKVKKEITLESGKAYDFKTIYNPQKGRVEVYVNNKFTASWVDRYPLYKGSAVSLRTGTSRVVYDNLRIYQARGNKIDVLLGDESGGLVPDNVKLKVFSLIVDRNIHWSKVGEEETKIGDPRTIPVSQSTDQTTPPSDNQSTSTGSDKVFSADFSISSKPGNTMKTFDCVADFDGKRWSANRELGFFYDQFSTATLAPYWKMEAGNWTVNSGIGKLQQNNEEEGNANLYAPLSQTAQNIYLYHLKARMLSEGDNRRMGIHFFASEGNESNRGNSYLVWLRFNDTQKDRIEIYRSDGNRMPGFQASRQLDLSQDVEYDLKIMFDPSIGVITVYLNNQEIISWTDESLPVSSGSYVSLRTGNARVQFGDLQVYVLRKSEPLRITVGKGEKKMIRFKSSNEKPSGRLQSLHLKNDGKWSPVQQEDFIIK